MKKLFKRIGIFLLVVVGLYFIIGLFCPSTYKVERSKTMNASPAIVYSQISNLKNWNSWTAWARMDSAMTHSYEGTDGAVGSIMRWKSEEMGEGNVEITELVPNEKVGYKLTFVDWGSVSTGVFTIVDSAGASNVNWTNEGDVPFLMRTMCLFMGGMDAMMGPDFEKGLNNLTEITEAMPPLMEFPFYEVKEIQFGDVAYIGIEFDTLIAAVDSILFGMAYGQLGEYVAINKIEVMGAPVCITKSWDEVAGRCNLIPAFPVRLGTKVKDPRFVLTEFKNPKALVLDYYGDYMEIYKAHMFYDQYLTENSLKSSVCIEEYITDPMTVSTYDSVLTKVFYILD